MKKFTKQRATYLLKAFYLSLRAIRKEIFKKYPSGSAERQAVVEALPWVFGEEGAKLAERIKGMLERESGITVMDFYNITLLAYMKQGLVLRCMEQMKLPLLPNPNTIQINYLQWADADPADENLQPVKPPKKIPDPLRGL